MKNSHRVGTVVPVDVEICLFNYPLLPPPPPLGSVVRSTTRYDVRREENFAKLPEIGGILLI
jgi:hypothetical protein